MDTTDIRLKMLEGLSTRFSLLQFLPEEEREKPEVNWKISKTSQEIRRLLDGFTHIEDRNGHDAVDTGIARACYVQLRRNGYTRGELNINATGTESIVIADNAPKRPKNP